jgi:hypothetical protein
MSSHDDKPEDSGHPPHLFYPPRVPRREIDWEKVDMRWMAGRSDNETRLDRFFGAIMGFLSRLKRRQHKAHATDEAHAVLTDDEITRAAAERLALDMALQQELQPSAAELAERRALDAAVRQELEQCTDEELELLADLRIMFSTNCPPETRARSTTQRRIAQELLDERAGCASSYQPGNVTIACSIHVDDSTAGGKSFRDRQRDLRTNLRHDQAPAD